MMNRASILVMAGAAELAAHFLSLAWGFGVIVIAFVWVAGLLRATMAAATAKAAVTETRVNGIITQLGTTNGNVTSATNTANSANSTANAAQATANNCLPLSGGTITGSLTINANLGVHGGTTLVGSSSCSNDWTVGGNLNADNTSTVFGNEGVHGTFTCLGTINGATIPSSAPGAASAPPNGTGGTSQYAGNFYTGSGAHTWAQGIANKIDQIISSLQSAGIYS